MLNINFKDKYVWQGFLLFAGCLTGVLFPGFLKYLLFIGMGVGVIGVVYGLFRQGVVKI